MDLAVGTSGFAYKEWKGTFYPADLKNDGMLAFYASRFPTVEINNTFYRMPVERTLLQWAEQVPDGFRFVLKASQKITHFKRLKDVQDELGYFLRTSSVLGPKRGPTLFQLPPNFKKDIPRLAAFIELIPRDWSAAFEFRHATWADGETYDLLRSRNLALCVADEDDRQGEVVATADYGYLRLRKTAYPGADLVTWAATVRAQPWKEAFVFFKHEDEGTGPALAAEFERAWTG